MTEKLQKELNEQITAEMLSANLYLSMSFFMQKEGYEGFAHWLKLQSQEETGHACKIAQYMIARGTIPKIDKIDVVPQSWKGPMEVFEDAYKHERHVSKLFDLLVEVAHDEKDNATQNFLWEFVHEQVEEEASVLSIVDKLRRTNSNGYLFIDSQLSKRK